MPINGAHSAWICSPRSSESISTSATLPMSDFVSVSKNGSQPFRSICCAAMTCPPQTMSWRHLLQGRDLRVDARQRLVCHRQYLVRPGSYGHPYRPFHDWNRRLLIRHRTLERDRRKREPVPWKKVQKMYFVRCSTNPIIRSVTR